MRIVAVTSQKGGSGKTTLAGNLAVAAMLATQQKVGIIDTDPQGSLMAWAEERSEEWPIVEAATTQTLDSTIERFRKAGCRMVFIDTPPAITRSIEGVVHRADMVVIPTRPSPHDLRAVGATVDLVEAIGKPLIFVINGATPRARLTGEAAIALSQHGTVAPQTVHNRQDFAWSMIDGRTVQEAAPKSRSAQEIKLVWEYVAIRLQRLPVKANIRSGLRERPHFGRANGMPARPADHQNGSHSSVSAGF